MSICWLPADFLKSLLDDNVDKSVLYCPYLIERSIVAIMRLAGHLVTAAKGKSKSSAVPRMVMGTSAPWPDSQVISQLIWSSMRYIRNVPADTLNPIAERIGAGVLSFIM
jgi:hypothetical protein